MSRYLVTIPEIIGFIHVGERPRSSKYCLMSVICLFIGYLYIIFNTIYDTYIPYSKSLFLVIPEPVRGDSFDINSTLHSHSSLLTPLHLRGCTSTSSYTHGGDFVLSQIEKSLDVVPETPWQDRLSPPVRKVLSSSRQDGTPKCTFLHILGLLRTKIFLTRGLEVHMWTVQRPNGKRKVSKKVVTIL